MADVKLNFPATTELTITLASLATSATLVAGRESTAVDNTSNLYLDAFIGGKVTTGTSPTAGVIEVWVFGAVDDAPVYPDVMDGTDSAETWTDVAIKRSSAALIARIETDTTSNRTYWFGPVSLTRAIGQHGPMWSSAPARYGIWVTHDTAVNLNSTAGNHAIYHWPVYHTVT